MFVTNTEAARLEERIKAVWKQVETVELMEAQRYVNELNDVRVKLPMTDPVKWQEIGPYVEAQIEVAQAFYDLRATMFRLQGR